MGFYDTVKLDREFPECGVQAGDVFQTKSLYAGCGEFTISAAGELVEHLYRHEPDPSRVHPITGHVLSKAVPTGEKAIAYHGDILLYKARSANDDAREFVARFTHGRLEWLRPLSTYPEVSRTLLVEQGAR